MVRVSLNDPPRYVSLTSNLVDSFCIVYGVDVTNPQLLVETFSGKIHAAADLSPNSAVVQGH